MILYTKTGFKRSFYCYWLGWRFLTNQNAETSKSTNQVRMVRTKEFVWELVDVVQKKCIIGKQLLNWIIKYSKDLSYPQRFLNNQPFINSRISANNDLTVPQKGRKGRQLSLSPLRARKRINYRYCEWWKSDIYKYGEQYRKESMSQYTKPIQKIK